AVPPNLDPPGIIVIAHVGIKVPQQNDRVPREQMDSAILERCLTQLVRQGKPYKYIMKYAVMQKTRACLHTANSCYWDTAMDESCTVRWENRTMYFVVSVFAVAIAQETHTYKCTYNPPLPEEEEEWSGFL
uniref:Dynein light chain Tctex-type 3 n=1 Tax=Monopterus albus TaxID=43700 RepID=A0A3Q3IE31_MONAL